jgi:hypothetical protein
MIDKDPFAVFGETDTTKQREALAEILKVEPGKITDTNFTMSANGDFKAEWSYIQVGRSFFTPSLSFRCAKTKKNFKYAPQDDITTVELAWLLNLFTYTAAAVSAVANDVDIDSYITDYKLERHFEIT